MTKRENILPIGGFWKGNIIIFPVGGGKRNESPNPHKNLPDHEPKKPDYQERAQYIKNRVWEVLVEAGACNNNRFATLDEESYYNERIAAYFIHDALETDRNIDPAFKTYVSNIFPAAFSFTGDEELIMLEQALDRAASLSHKYLIADADQQGTKLALLGYFEQVLTGQTLPMPYHPASHAQEGIRYVLDLFQYRYRQIRNADQPKPTLYL